MNYIKIMNWFWQDVPYRQGYKSEYGIVFLAVVDLCNRNDWRETSAEYDRMINKARVSKKLYYESIKWLQNENIIGYQRGFNDYAPAKFVVKAEVHLCTSTDTTDVPHPHLSDTTSIPTAVPIINKQINSKTDKPKKQKGPLRFPDFSTDLFKSVWAVLAQQPKWKNKTDDALQLSLDKLAKFNEPFAIQLMENAIAGNWAGIVFKQTAEEYQNFQRKPLHPERGPSVDSPTYAEMLPKDRPVQVFTPHFQLKT